MNRMRAKFGVVAMPVGGDRGLAIGAGNDDADRTRHCDEYGCEEASDRVAPGEPGQERRHLQDGVLGQQPGERLDVGIDEGRYVPVEQVGNSSVRATTAPRGLTGLAYTQTALVSQYVECN
jgi:hypothetical protein